MEREGDAATPQWIFKSIPTRNNISVPGASNKLNEWVNEYAIFLRGNGGRKETKFGTQVA